MSERTVPPGWYPDPHGQARQRWHDGSTWTASTRGPARREARARRSRGGRPWFLLGIAAAFVAAGLAWSQLVPESLPDESALCDALEPLAEIPDVPRTLPRFAPEWEPVREERIAALERRAEILAAAVDHAIDRRREDFEVVARDTQRAVEIARNHRGHDGGPGDYLILPPAPPPLPDGGASGIRVRRFIGNCGI